MSNTQYGLLSIFSTMTEILFYVMALGMLTSFFRFYSEATDRAAKQAILSATFWTITAMAAAITVLMAPAATIWSRVLFQSAENWHYVLLALPATYFAVLISLGDCRIQADGKAFLFLQVNIVQVLTTRGLALFLLILGWGALGWIGGMIMGQIATMIVFAFVVYRNLSIRVDPALLRKLVPYGVVLLPTAISAWLMYGVTKILMVWIFRWQGNEDPLAEVALFSVGERISQVMFMMSLAFVLGWRRFAFSNMHHPDGRRLLGNGVTVFLALTGYAAVGLISLGDELLRLMIPERLWDGIAVIPYLTMAGFLWGVGEVMNIGMHKANKTRLMSSLYILTAGMNLGLNLALIPWLGIIGAALSLMLCETLKAVLIWRTAQAAFALDIDYRRLGLAIAVYLPAVGSCIALSTQFSIASVSLQVVIVGAVPLILIALGFLKPAERQAIGSWVTQIKQRVIRGSTG